MFSSAAAAELVVGDCLKMGGLPDRPEATKAACGAPGSNFKVVAVFFGSEGTDQRPTDVDWVVGGCMSDDRSLPGRQRATQILHDVANVDRCAGRVGYAYDERNFTICVEDVA